jgi:FixJ family two-component response regulator
VVKFGAIGPLMKPFTIQQLCDVVASALTGKKD